MKIKSMLDFYNNIYYIKWKFLQIENFEETKERIYYKYQWKKIFMNPRNLLIMKKI